MVETNSSIDGMIMETIKPKDVYPFIEFRRNIGNIDREVSTVVIPSKYGLFRSLLTNKPIMPKVREDAKPTAA
jgi:hypothetical protein